MQAEQRETETFQLWAFNITDPQFNSITNEVHSLVETELGKDQLQYGKRWQIEAEIRDMTDAKMPRNAAQAIKEAGNSKFLENFKQVVKTGPRMSFVAKLPTATKYDGIVIGLGKINTEWLRMFREATDIYSSFWPEHKQTDYDWVINKYQPDFKSMADAWMEAADMDGGYPAVVADFQERLDKIPSNSDLRSKLQLEFSKRCTERRAFLLDEIPEAKNLAKEENKALLDECYAATIPGTIWREALDQLIRGYRKEPLDWATFLPPRGAARSVNEVPAVIACINLILKTLGSKHGWDERVWFVTDPGPTRWSLPGPYGFFNDRLFTFDTSDSGKIPSVYPDLFQHHRELQTQRMLAAMKFEARKYTPGVLDLDPEATKRTKRERNESKREVVYSRLVPHIMSYVQGHANRS